MPDTDPCPEIIITPMTAYTSVPNAESHHGLVAGTGTTVDAALLAMHAKAEEYARNIVQAAWNNDSPDPRRLSWHSIVRDSPGSKLRGTFLVVAVRLAGAGPVDGEPGWTAYGTLASASVFMQIE